VEAGVVACDAAACSEHGVFVVGGVLLLSVGPLVVESGKETGEEEPMHLGHVPVRADAVWESPTCPELDDALLGMVGLSVAVCCPQVEHEACGMLIASVLDVALHPELVVVGVSSGVVSYDIEVDSGQSVPPWQLVLTIVRE